MARYKLTLEYEGTRYSGWQVQKNARTVQGELIEAARGAFGTSDFELMGSGRTDAGVHALCQVAHLDVRTQLDPRVIRMRLNDALPADINVIDVQVAPQRFHARHHAVSRTYLYQISQRRTAFGKRYVWWIKDRLDVEAMAEACAVFEGFHDFRSFTRDDPEEKSTTVELQECYVAVAGDLILIRIRGSHFLWRMVRQMVGMIAQVGRGATTVDELRELLRTASSLPASVTAPPSGLFLEHVAYDDDDGPQELSPTIRI